MPLESCMILLDNSEFMRNGDFVPTRIEQQFDAFSRVADAKLRHPESMLGLMTMAGKTCVPAPAPHPPDSRPRA